MCEDTRASQDFLVKRVLDDGTVVNVLMTGGQLGKYISMDDIHNESYEIYYVKGDVVHYCMYKGWQPNCLIEVVDTETQETVLSYIGEDH